MAHGALQEHHYKHMKYMHEHGYLRLAASKYPTSAATSDDLATSKTSPSRTALL
jgi:hypothetical protein